MNNFSTILLFVFFSLFFYRLKAQDGYKVIYKVNPINIIDNNEIYESNQTPALKNLLKKAIKIAKSEDYILLCNNLNSYFFKLDKLDISKNDKSSEMYSRFAGLITAFNVNVSVDYEENNLIFSRALGGNTYNVTKNEFYDFNWNITDDKKVICGLEAKKAVGTYFDIIRNKEFEIIAWFIPSIPIPAGPDIYFGLPGLVGEVQLRKAIVKIESIEEYNESVRQPTFKDVMSYEDYLDFVTKANAKIKKEYN